MASILAVRALHASRVLEKLAAESTAHDVVKLLLHELVTILLDDLLLSLANGTFTTKSDIKRLLVLGMFDCRLLVVGSKQVVLNEREPIPKDMVN